MCHVEYIYIYESYYKKNIKERKALNFSYRPNVLKGVILFLFEPRGVLRLDLKSDLSFLSWISQFLSLVLTTGEEFTLNTCFYMFLYYVRAQMSLQR